MMREINLNFYICRTLTHSFPYPLALTVLHILFSFAVLTQPSLNAGGVDALRANWRGVAAIGALFSGNVGLNNCSLAAGMSLSLNQVIRCGRIMYHLINVIYGHNSQNVARVRRSAMPVATAALCAAADTALPTARVVLSLLLMSAGAGMCMYHNDNRSNTPLAVGLCLGGMLSNGVMVVLSSRLLTENMPPSLLIWCSAPAAFLLLCPFVWRFEGAVLIQHFAALPAHSYGAAVLATCALALLYNIIHNRLIHATSAVTSTVVGQCKILVLLVFSAVILGERDFTGPQSLAGCATALTGFSLYAQAKLKS